MPLSNGATSWVLTKRLAASIHRDAHDIWILDGFETPRFFLRPWFSRK